MVVLRPTLPSPIGPLLEDRDVGDAVVAGQVVGGGEPVAAAAHDHDAVVRPRRRLGPGTRPAALPGEALAQQAPRGIASARGAPGECGLGRRSVGHACTA